MDEAPAAAAGPARAAPAARRRWRSWLLPAGLLSLLAVLTANVLAGGPLVTMDRWIQHAVRAQDISARWWWVGHGRTSPAGLVDFAANPEVGIGVLALTAVLTAAWRRSFRPLASAVLGGALLVATVIPAKILIGRPHPGHAVLLRGTLGDFPSGHTTTATVCYVLAALLLAPRPGSWSRGIALAVAWVLAVLVGLTLIWVDAHWFTDVVAGWALGGLITHLTMRLAGRRREPAGRPQPAGTGAGGRELQVPR